MKAAGEGEALVTALARGIPIDEAMLSTLTRLVELHVAELTWQWGFEPVPRPRWVEVRERLREARVIIEEVRGHLDDDVCRQLDEHVRRAAA